MATVGRPNRLNDDSFCDLIAAKLAEGISVRALAKDPMVNASESTDSTWKRDPRIKARLTKLINQRVQEVTRRVDWEISNRLQDASGLSMRELLDIRREFLNGALRDRSEEHTPEPQAHS